MPRLRRVEPYASPGWRRIRRGSGFAYVHADGSTADRAERARIAELAVPPAWQDVWIADVPNAHILAVGQDAAGRRQYLYHPAWRERQDAAKFQRMTELVRALPGARRLVLRDLSLDELPRDRVLAAAVRMLDIGVFRAGGEQYAPGDDDEDEGGTFGLATLRREHVRLKRGAVLFSYTAKGGIPRELALRDPLLHRIVNSLLRRQGGGEELLAYKDRRTWIDIRTSDLNAAVKELAGEQYTCKDLRTWNATVLAAVTLAAGAAQGGVPTSQRARKRMVTAAIKAVSEHLGNTPTVARSSYVDPRVVERFEEGRTILRALQDVDTAAAAPDMMDDASRAAVERAVVRLIAAE